MILTMETKEINQIVGYILTHYEKDMNDLWGIISSTEKLPILEGETPEEALFKTGFVMCLEWLRDLWISGEIKPKDTFSIREVLVDYIDGLIFKRKLKG